MNTFKHSIHTQERCCCKTQSFLKDAPCVVDRSIDPS